MGFHDLRLRSRLARLAPYTFAEQLACYPVALRSCSMPARKPHNDFDSPGRNAVERETAIGICERGIRVVGHEQLARAQ